MPQTERFTAVITFLPPEEGGLTTLPQPPFVEVGPSYEPMLCVGDTELRVRFVGGPVFTAGEPARVYFVSQLPEADCSPLRVGARIAIREGDRNVVIGNVVERTPRRSRV